MTPKTSYSFKVVSHGSYLFLRMKLLLENLKLCWGTHDILLPMLILDSVCISSMKDCWCICRLD